MPELPEVETVRRGLIGVLEGKRIAHVAVRRRDLRRPFPARLAARLKGRRIERIDRRAKYLLFHLDDGMVLLVHLGMSGRLVIADPSETPGPHTHGVVETEDGVRILYNAARRFGLMDLVSQNQVGDHELLRDLGPEPLGDAFTGTALSAALKGRKAPIKALLMDQRIVAGLGNIYVCESLYRAGLSPRRTGASVAGARAERLVKAIRAVLAEAIEAGGSSLRDYVQASGELGYFQYSFAVYGREGEVCPRGGAGGQGHVVRRIVQSNRATFYCPKCQR